MTYDATKYAYLTFENVHSLINAARYFQKILGTHGITDSQLDTALTEAASELYKDHKCELLIKDI